MSFIQDLGNNKPLNLSRTMHDINFIKENKDEIKSIFEEIKENAKAKAEERKESPLGFLTNGLLGALGVPSLFDYIGAAMQNEDLKELVGEYKDSAKANTENWLQEETLIGDIANNLNKDKNIEVEG